MQQKQDSLRNQEEKLLHLKEELDHVSSTSFCWLWYFIFFYKCNFIFLIIKMTFLQLKAAATDRRPGNSPIDPRLLFA